MRERIARKLNKKGFTLAELLIVVAIIAVLVAIAIPVFTTQLEKAREATDLANVRSAYAELVSSYLTTGESTTVNVEATQTQEGWQYVETGEDDDGNAYIGTEISVDGDSDSPSYKIPVEPSTKDKGGWKLTIDDTTGKVSIVSATSSDDSDNTGGTT